VSNETSIDRQPFPIDEAALERMFAWAQERIINGPDPRNGAQDIDVLRKSLSSAITERGMTGEDAFSLFADVIAPSTRPFNHPTSLAFVAAAPTPASFGMDVVLGAAEIFAGNWDGGSGAIHAENQALAWLAGLAGWPDSAGGVFVSGGTMGNLSALHAARVRCLKNLDSKPARWQILCSVEAHSSIAAVASVMDADLVKVPTDTHGRMSAQDASDALFATDGVFVVVANAGATNCGAVDDIAGLANLAREHNIWLHVDGAYGLAALASPDMCGEFAGIELADSFIVDPHKWLFAPYDSCALVYRNPLDGAQAHGQQGAYLDTLDHGQWNPSDYALHLTRRARGLPLWFSLVTYGTAAYAYAIDRTCLIAQRIADGIDSMNGLELILGPQLTVILFRATEVGGQSIDDWAEKQRRSGALLCLPTTWDNEKVLRICVVNPQTDPVHVLTVLKTLTSA